MASSLKPHQQQHLRSSTASYGLEKFLRQATQKLPSPKIGLQVLSQRVARRKSMTPNIHIPIA